MNAMSSDDTDLEFTITVREKNNATVGAYMVIDNGAKVAEIATVAKAGHKHPEVYAAFEALVAALGRAYVKDHYPEADKVTVAKVLPGGGTLQ